MKEIIYICDNCQKEICQAGGTETKRHIRILKAEIRDNQKRFEPVVNHDVNGDGLHFCNPQCLKVYFQKKFNQLKK
jgi:hypothetical protein